MKNKSVITLALGAAAAYFLLGNKKAYASGGSSGGTTGDGEQVVDSGTEDVNGVRYDWRVVSYTLADGFGGTQYQAQLRGYHEGVPQPWAACSEAADPVSAAAGKEQCVKAINEISAMG